MKGFAKYAATALVALMLFLLLEMAVFAAPSVTYNVRNPIENTRNVAQAAAALEEKYGISVVYPTVTGADGQPLAAIIPQMLRTLDEALNTVTPELVRKVSAYYYELTQQRLTYSYTYADLRGPYSPTASNEVTVGGFIRKTATIELYIPSQQGQAVSSGDNPLTVVHEFAHAVHAMLADSYGYARMQREWLALMPGHTFMPERVDAKTFVTAYAATQFDEDFAETFAHVFVCNRPGLGFSNRLGSSASPTALGRKVAYIERLLAHFEADNPALLLNYRKIYETPVSVRQDGLRLSGAHLLFIGMEEPRTVPLLILEGLPVAERNTVWFPHLGGWYCRDANGNHLVLFPEGTYGDAGRDLVALAREKRAAEEAAAGATLLKPVTPHLASGSAAGQPNQPTAGGDMGTSLFKVIFGWLTAG